LTVAEPSGSSEDRRVLQRLLDDTRRKLVETGTRNRLVHVNRTKTRGNILNIVNERSDDVYSLLACGKTMRFRAIGTDHEEGSDAIRLADAHEDGFDTARFTDTELETRLGPNALQKKLLKIAREAKTAEEEQGANILYLALGFLNGLRTKHRMYHARRPSCFYQWILSGTNAPRHMMCGFAKGTLLLTCPFASA
jgi:hypothetical protein